MIRREGRKKEKKEDSPIAPSASNAISVGLHLSSGFPCFPSSFLLTRRVIGGSWPINLPCKRNCRRKLDDRKRKREKEKGPSANCRHLVLYPLGRSFPVLASPTISPSMTDFQSSGPPTPVLYQYDTAFYLLQPMDGGKMYGTTQSSCRALQERIAMFIDS